MPDQEELLDTALLFRDAEIRAERLIGIMRMVVAFGLGAVFYFAVTSRPVDASDILVRQWTYAGLTMAAYFLVGLATWAATYSGWFRGWMMWAAAVGDCLFILVSIWLSIGNTGLDGGHAFIFPSIWLVPMVLAFGAMRYSVGLQAFVVGMLSVGILVILLFEPATSFEPTIAAVELFLAAPPNVMRVAMIAMGGAVLVVAALRTRRLLHLSIVETQRRANLTRYLPAQLAPRLAGGGLNELRRGRKVNAGILFADMRGFTGMSQRMQPEELSDFMSDFRSLVSRTVRDTGGIVDKFMGDAAMIVFEGADSPARSARSCVECGLALNRAVNQWSADRAAAGNSPVRVGIGMHWGEVFSGVVGDADRLEYSVFGDCVNIAARLEELTKTYDRCLIASADLLAQAGAEDGWTALGEAQVRGRSGNLAIFGLGTLSKD